MIIRREGKGERERGNRRGEMGKKVESAPGYEKGSKGGSRHRIEKVSESSHLWLEWSRAKSGFTSFFDFAVYVYHDCSPLRPCPLSAPNDALPSLDWTTSLHPHP